MTPAEVADLLDGYAGKVTKLRGVSRHNPHAFAEDKSELAGEIRAKARELRTPGKAPPNLTTFRPGTIRVSGRTIRVETRRKAS